MENLKRRLSSRIYLVERNHRRRINEFVRVGFHYLHWVCEECRTMSMNMTPQYVLVQLSLGRSGISFLLLVTAAISNLYTTNATQLSIVCTQLYSLMNRAESPWHDVALAPTLRTAEVQRPLERQSAHQMN